MHRIFIAINLPENIKQKLNLYQERLEEIPAKWTKKENLHITLVFLGNVAEAEIPEICKIVERVVQKNSPFFLILKSILYGPPKKPPRMVWVKGEESLELGQLQKDLEKALIEQTSFQKENKGYAPHITLARIKQWQFKQMDQEALPEVNEEISLSFPVNSIEIMESKLRPQGPEYFILESIPLKD